MRIKICGITQVEEALALAHMGVDALGFVFYEKSPRCITLEKACSIVQALPPFVSTVGLFVNHEAAFVQQVLDHVHLDYLQFHGDETSEYCAQFNYPFIKALRVKPGMDLVQYGVRFSGAKALLVDAYVEGLPGGTGQVFDWQLIPKNMNLPIILSGGLTPENVVQAMSVVTPWAVDVSSGVEVKPGSKDLDKCYAFIKGVRNETL